MWRIVEYCCRIKTKPKPQLNLNPNAIQRLHSGFCILHLSEPILNTYTFLPGEKVVTSVALIAADILYILWMLWDLNIEHKFFGSYAPNSQAIQFCPAHTFEFLCWPELSQFSLTCTGPQTDFAGPMLISTPILGRGCKSPYWVAAVVSSPHPIPVPFKTSGCLCFTYR